MARLFDDASSQYLESATAVATAAPLSMACWFNSDDATIQQTLMALVDTANTGSYFALLANGNVAGDPIRAATAQNGAGQVQATSTSGYTANVWAHACGVFTSATSRTVYLDGGSSATETSNRTPGSIDTTNIGVRGGSSRSNFMSGLIAEAAIWDVALTAADVASLAAGYSPLLIRPANLLAYWPLIGRTSPEIDTVGGVGLTVTGAVAAPHPRIVYNPIPNFARFGSGAPVVKTPYTPWPQLAPVLAQ